VSCVWHTIIVIIIIIIIIMNEWMIQDDGVGGVEGNVGVAVRPAIL
jgi:hypothetical protein